MSLLTDSENNNSTILTLEIGGFNIKTFKMHRIYGC